PVTRRSSRAATASTAARKSSTPSPTAVTPPEPSWLAGPRPRPRDRCHWRSITMADLSIDFCGIESPNPCWLASAPPANTGEQIMRAFDAGWGGAVWKTLGDPIMNVTSRFGSVDYDGRKMMGLNNIELITDRPLEENLREIREVKKRYPNNVVIASLMTETKH